MAMFYSDCMIRDESFITRLGSGYIQGGSETCLVMYLGGQIKALGVVGVIYFIGGEGVVVRCVPLVLAFIKSQSFWGRSRPDPLPYPAPNIPSDTASNMTCSENGCKK